MDVKLEAFVNWAGSQEPAIALRVRALGALVLAVMGDQCTFEYRVAEGMVVVAPNFWVLELAMSTLCDIAFSSGFPEVAAFLQDRLLEVREWQAALVANVALAVTD